jgi:hypothetical protein
VDLKAVSLACFSVRGVFLFGWSMLRSECYLLTTELVEMRLTANSWPLDVVKMGAGDFCCHVFVKKMQHSL